MDDEQTPLGAHSHHFQCSTSCVVTKEHQPLVETPFGRKPDLHGRLGNHLPHPVPPDPVLACRLRELYPHRPIVHDRISLRHS